MGVQDRADGENVSEVRDGHGGVPQCNSQSEVATKGKTDDKAGSAV